MAPEETQRGGNGAVATAGSDTLTVSGGTAASPVRFASISEIEAFTMTGGFATLSGQAQLGTLTMTGKAPASEYTTFIRGITYNYNSPALPQDTVKMICIFL